MMAISGIWERIISARTKLGLLSPVLRLYQRGP